MSDVTNSYHSDIINPLPKIQDSYFNKLQLEPSSSNLPFYSYEPDDYDNFDQKLLFETSSVNPFRLFDSLKYLMLQILSDLYSKNFHDDNESQDSKFQLLEDSSKQNFNDFKYHQQNIFSGSDGSIMRDYLLILNPLLKRSINSNEKEFKLFQPIILSQLQFLKDRYTYERQEKINLTHFENTSFTDNNLPLDETDSSFNQFRNFPPFPSSTYNFEELELPFRVEELKNLSHISRDNRPGKSHKDQNLSSRHFYVNEPQLPKTSNSEESISKDNNYETAIDSLTQERQSISHPTVYLNSDQTSWVVKWMNGTSEIRRNFSIEKYGFQRAKDKAHAFSKSFPKNFKNPQSEAQEGNSQSENARMVTRQISIVTSPTSDIMDEIRQDSSESLPNLSKSSSYDLSNSQSSKDKFRPTTNFKKRLKRTVKISSDGSKSITKATPGRPRIHSITPPKSIKIPSQSSDTKVSTVTERPSGGSYNISDEHSGNYKNENHYNRIEKLRQKAEDYPYYLGVVFEVHNFAWVAKMNGESRRFLVKKHGWEKAHHLAVHRVMSWRATLPDDERKLILEKEEEMIAFLRTKPSLSSSSSSNTIQDSNSLSSIPQYSDFQENSINYKQEELGLEDFSSRKFKKSKKMGHKDFYGKRNYFITKGAIQDSSFRVLPSPTPTDTSYTSQSQSNTDSSLKDPPTKSEPIINSDSLIPDSSIFTGQDLSEF